MVGFDEIENLLDAHIRRFFPDFNHHGNPHHAFTAGGQTFNYLQNRMLAA